MIETWFCQFDVKTEMHNTQVNNQAVVTLPAQNISVVTTSVINFVNKFLASCKNACSRNIFESFKYLAKKDYLWSRFNCNVTFSKSILAKQKTQKVDLYQLVKIDSFAA